MRNSRLGFLIVTLVLLSGLGTACKKGLGDLWGSDHFQPLIETQELEIPLVDASRRQSALALFRSPNLGLLHESSPDKLRQDSEAALTALTDTIPVLPEALRRTFGPKVAEDLTREFEFQKIECAHSACFVDVYYRSWRAFQGLNQLLDVDKNVPWNKYRSTRYRSGRVAIKDDDQKRFLVTWALVFPLKSIDDELAERRNAAGKKGG